MDLQKPEIIQTIEQAGFKPKRKGKSFWLSCPFHEEKTPSLKIDPERQSFFCFGCHTGGDSISFIQKLYSLSFKDALSFLGIRPGSPAPIDPSVQRRRTLQHSYEKAITEIYDNLCERSRHLHRICLQVKKSPSALTDAGIVLFANQMVELTEIDHRLNVLLTGTVEDQISILMETMKYDCTKTIARAA